MRGYSLDVQVIEMCFLHLYSGFFNGGHYDGYGGPDFGKGHWGGGQVVSAALGSRSQ